MIKIIIQSVNKSFLKEIDRIYGEISVKLPIPNKIIVPTTVLSLPLTLYNFTRKQYVAERVNDYIYNYYKTIIDKVDNLYVVGIIEGDGYSNGLNFVFGLATPPLKVASIYTRRISGMGDESKFNERLKKLVLHELGHLLGLGHCNNYCVMRFSNTLRELDEKPDKYCNVCEYKLTSLVERI